MKVLLFLALPLVALATEHAVGVRGILKCNGEPIQGITALYDDIYGVDPLLDEGTSDEKGFFELEGSYDNNQAFVPKL